MKTKGLVAWLDRAMTAWRKQVQEGVILPPHAHQKAGDQDAPVGRA